MGSCKKPSGATSSSSSSPLFVVAKSMRQLPTSSTSLNSTLAHIGTSPASQTPAPLKCGAKKCSGFCSKVHGQLRHPNPAQHKHTHPTQLAEQRSVPTLNHCNAASFWRPRNLLKPRKGGQEALPGIFQWQWSARARDLIAWASRKKYVLAWVLTTGKWSAASLSLNRFASTLEPRGAFLRIPCTYTRVQARATTSLDK